LDGTKGIVPSPQARIRIGELLSVLPKRKWHSLIDVGCAKGMFLYWALSAFDLKRATGLEPAPDMAEAARLVGEYLNAPAAILHGSLLDLYRAIPPADLVFVFHCYHYLYFGSEGGHPGLADHEGLFSVLARLCGHTLVFANPLELEDRKKKTLRDSGVSESILAGYNTKAILGGAEKFFSIHPSTLGGGRPYIVMTRLGAGAAGARDPR
jgi:SAM-dependent methyltransferase